VTHRAFGMLWSGMLRASIQFLALAGFSWTSACGAGSGHAPSALRAPTAQPAPPGVPKGNIMASGHDNAELLKDACSNGLGDACDELRAMCDRNDVHACAWLAELLTEGKAVPRDLEAAFALFNRACHARLIPACVQVGIAYERGLGVPLNLAKAMEMFLRSCSEGQEYGCFDAAMVYRDQMKDAKSSVPFFDKGCQLHYADSCVGLGIAYEEGRGVVADLPRAASLYDQGCTRGSALGCDRLARLLVDARGVPADYPRARTLSEAGCRGEYADGCYIHGYLLREGLGGQKDPVKGKAFIDEACRLGSARACGDARHLQRARAKDQRRDGGAHPNAAE